VTLNEKIVLSLVGYFYAVLTFLEFFLWGNVPKGMMMGSLSLIALVFTRVDVRLMWKTKDRPVLENIKSQGGRLVPLRLVPVMLFAMAIGIWGFFLQF
jgi:hypothetical protein